MSQFFTPLCRISLSSVLLLCCFLMGCKHHEQSSAGESEEVLKFQAQKHLQNKKYQSAIEPLQHLSHNHLGSSEAQVYKLELMHAQYQAREFMAAVDSADQYLLLYPYEPDVDYAMYMKMIASLKEFESRQWVPKIVQQKYSYTETEVLESALGVSEHLITSYPDSQYHQAAIVVQNEIKEIFQRKNFAIARHYRRKQAYAASQRRLTDIIINTNSKKLLYKSLRMMYDNYMSMKQLRDAEVIAQLLRKNYHV